MSSHDLRRQLAELRAMVEALQPSHQAEDYVAACFSDAKFAPHLDAIIAHLCGATPSYSFVVEADPEEGGHSTHYMAMWYDRADPPIVIQYTRRWRAVHGDLPEPTSYDLTDEPPAQAATALASTSYHLTAPEQTVNNDTSDVSARPETAPTSVQSHSERPAELPVEERAKIESEIVRLKAEIARLKPPTPQQTF